MAADARREVLWRNGLVEWDALSAACYWTQIACRRSSPVRHRSGSGLSIFDKLILTLYDDIEAMVISAYLQSPAVGAGNRRTARRTLQLEVQGAHASDGSLVVKIHNISLTGMLIECDARLAVDDQIDVDLPHAGSVATRVIWASENLFGCQFETPISAASLSAAQLQSAVRPEEPEELFLPMLPVEGEADEPGFGANLKRLRLARGLSQAAVAEHMGVSAPSISGWENGRTRPKHDRIAVLADLLAVPVTQLLVDASSSASAELISQGRERIARGTGVSPDRVRIFIEV
ncbi:MAG: helix-turn-helix domain-containing protein [Sphingomonadales bacterium]|nr:MAG: helix-turn-helix domain-containing protein [Sphingomonadales bacterium]